MGSAAGAAGRWVSAQHMLLQLSSPIMMIMSLDQHVVAGPQMRPEEIGGGVNAAAGMQDGSALHAGMGRTHPVGCEGGARAPRSRPWTVEASLAPSRRYSGPWLRGG